MKQNDWIVAGLTNPDTTTSEFLISGLNTDNTLLLSPDEYKKSSFVRDHFTENDVFNEDAFDAFYKKRASEFGRLQTLDIKDTFLYNPLDPRAAGGKKNTKSPEFSYELVANPNKEINFFGSIYESDLSKRELAQKNKIYDTATLTWSEDTLNDRAFVNSPFKWFKTAFGEPLVYATYNEDGEHYDTFLGRTVKHTKGEYKLDAKGNPYTETLNGRSLIGKEVVAAGDILTVDKEGVDKYNFFDSDDVDKSVGGTVMKTIAAVAPMLMGPYVAPVYSGLLVGRELLKTLPMLYGLTTAWFDMPEENATLNKLAAYGNVFTTSTSDYGRSKMLNTEVIATLMSDVALQWGLQKFIANGISKLRGTKKLMDEAYSKAGITYAMNRAALELLLSKGVITKEAFEKVVGDAKNWQKSALGMKAIEKFTKNLEPIVKRSNRLGADAALAYMALVSNTDVYSSMLEAGASRKEAATVALGSTLGMFAVDKYLHLGELFFDDLTADYERLLRRTFTKEAKSWYENVIKLNVKDPELSKFDKFRRVFQSGIDYGKKKTSQFAEDLKYHSTGFFGKAIGEGLEEVSEELVSDISKGIYEVMGDLGFDTTVKKVGAFDNFLARYGMSFLGGTLGGGLFYGVNLYLNGKFHVDLTLDELIYLVRNGKTEEALKTLDEWRRKGKLGDTSLSTEVVKDEEGNDVFVSASDPSKSLNEFIYNRIRETILSLENIINENLANLNEDDLFDNMILSEIRFRDLQKYLENTGSSLNLLDFSYTTGYQRAYLKALSNVIDLERTLDVASHTKTGLPSTEESDIATDLYLRNMTEEEKKRRNSNLKKVQDQLKEAKDELNRFLSGEYSIEYTEKMLFALDKHLNEDYVAMTYDLWLDKNHDGKTSDSLSPSESAKYKEEYLKYKAAAQSLDLDLKFTIYKAIKELMNPVLLLIQEGLEGFAKFREAVALLHGENSPLLKIKQYTEDDVLDFVGETEDSDSYLNRLLKEYSNRRVPLIIEENRKLMEILKNSLLKIIDDSGGFIDPVARRELKLLLRNRNKDSMQRLLQNISVDIANGNTETDVEGRITKKGVLTDLDRSVLLLLEKIDVNKLEDANKIWDEIRALITEDYLKPIKLENSRWGNLRAYLAEAPINSSRTIDPEGTDILGSLLKTIIDALVAKGLTLDLIFDIANTSLYSNDFGDYGVLAADLEAFFSTYNIRDKYEDGTLGDFEWKFRDPAKSVNDLKLQKTLSKYNLIFRNYLDELKTDPMITLNLELDARVSNINPVTELVKALGLSLNVNMLNLEKILSGLDSRLEEADSVDDLILASEEKESFEEAEYIIKLAKAYLYAASATPSILAPFGHNAILNEFAEHHKDIYKDYTPLPVLSGDVALMYESELNRYLNEMGIRDEETGEYNIGSWRWLSAENEGNKALMFIKAEKAWCKAIYDVFATDPDAFKFEYEGTSYDLLKGFESVPQITENTKDALVHLNKLFNLFYNNVLDLINKGWSYKLIWERSKILEKICGIKNEKDGTVSLNNVMSQKTAALDENITFDRMTGYDKMVLLTTAAAMNSTKFYSYLKTRIDEEDGIVPLTILEWVSRVGIAQIENPDIFYQTLEYLQKETSDSRPIIYGVYVGGSAGAGKSRVIGRNIVKYIKGNNIWLSAPKESLIDTLFESVGKGIKHLNREISNTRDDLSTSLMDKIGVDKEAYDKAIRIISSKDALKLLEENPSPYFIVNTDEVDADIITVDVSKFGVKKIDNAPEAIVIDEVTHLSNLELLLLSYFCKLNGTKLILLGDNKQRGFTGLGRNIDRELCLTIRTPELSISLRDNNLQHYINLKILERLINSLSNLDEKELGKAEYDTLVNTIRSLLNGIKFKVYNLDDIHGDLLIKSLTSQQIQNMKGSVGYVGRKGATLDALQASGLSLTVLPETDILGQEFDYIVIDKDFILPESKGSDVLLLQFLQDLYTMISRGRNGSIIIDPDGSLLRVIGENRVEFAKAKATSILQYAGKFREEKIKLLDLILGSTSQKETNDAIKKEVLKEEEAHNDIKTDGTEIAKLPVVTPKEFEKIEVSEDEIPLHSEDIPGNPMLCYGGATFTGFSVEVRDGKQVWLNPETEVKRDGLLFTTESEIIDDGLQIEISKKIRRFKNAFLYRKRYDLLPKYITDLISLKDYEGMRWYIEVAPRGELDNFIRNTPFKEDKMSISSKGLVFKIVGEFDIKTGGKGQITLGLMGDPDNWIKQIPKKIKPRIKGKISKLEAKLSGKEVLTLAKRDAILNKIDKYKLQLERLNLDKLDSDPNKYKAYIEELAGLYDGKNPLRKEIASLIYPGITDLHKLDKSIRLTRLSKDYIANAKKRIAKLLEALKKAKGDQLLKSKISSEIKRAEKKLQEFEQIRDYSFKSLNPYTNISPMYIYTPTAGAKLDVDDSMIGKCCVVFVTDDDSLDPNELVNIYIEQKNKTEVEKGEKGVIDFTDTSVVPSVRMIKLDNLGVSFQDMSDPYLAESMTSTVSYKDKDGNLVESKQIYPFKTNYMGVRMYVGLWNFRANLLQFEKQFRKFKENLPIDISKLDTYLMVKDLKWRSENKEKLTKEEKDFLNKNLNLEKFDEVSKLVDDFNDFLGDKVKLFRLGSDLDNGAYIRYLTGNISSLYNTDKKANGIYVNYSTFTKYLNIANSLFKDVLDHIVECNYAPDRLLSTKEGVKNSFANHIRSLANTDGIILVMDAYTKDNPTIYFGSKYDTEGSKGILNTFSHIPAVLSKVFKFTSIRQSHLLANTFDIDKLYSIRILGTVEIDGKEVKVDKPIPYWNLWENVSMILAATEYDVDLIKAYKFDPTLSNFFSFAFHGTLEDIDSDAQRASDALFPKGFFADPLSTADTVSGANGKIFTKAVQLKIFFGSDVRVSSPTFFISLEALLKAVNLGKKPIVPVVDTLVDLKVASLINDVTSKYPQLASEFSTILESLLGLTGQEKVTEALNSIYIILERETTNNFRTIFSGTIKNIDPNALVQLTSDTEAITLGLLVRSRYNETYSKDLPEITSISVDGKSLIIDAGDITIKVNKNSDGSITVKEIGAPPVESSIVELKVTELISSIQNSLNADLLKDLTEAIKIYATLSNDLKTKLKEVIINKLNRIGTKLMSTNLAAFRAIRKVISEIKQPKCL